MKDTIAEMDLDRENVEFNYAADFVRHTDKIIYLTGKAGTGKTTFLKYIKETTTKNTVVLAPTGVAAINAGGVTIHSFFQIPFGPFVPDDSRLRTSALSSDNKETIYTTFKYREDKKKIIETLELLIIDEVSMVRVDTLDVIDRILKVFRKKPYLPFGGVQVILIGDTFQLPPIADKEQWRILSKFYKTQFFFSSKVIERNTPLYIELKKIYRQNEQDFIDLLNRVRVSQVTPKDLQVLNAKYDPAFSGNGSDYIILATHNKIVNATNLTKLSQLKTETFTYEAKVTGTFPDKHKPTDHFLKLKVDAQIMFIKNDPDEYKRFYNGKIGRVKKLEESSITVIFDNGSEVKVERAEWNNIQYSYDPEQKKIVEEIIGTFEQFPIRLAWAITVHKSQGLTFEKVIADLGKAFAPGQVYVALSRCTSFNGLILKTPLNNYAIKTDPRVIEFAKNETPETLITQQLNTGRADYNYKKAREEFSRGNLKSAFESVKTAIKYRNDIETEKFQKFIEIKGRRQFGNKEKLSVLEREIKLLKEDLNEHKTTIAIQEQIISSKDQQIAEQITTLELLHAKNEITAGDSEKLKLKLIKATEQKEKLAIQISRLKKRLTKTTTKLKDAETKIESCIEKIQFYKAEIDRISKISWYEKLFGKK